MTNAEMIKRRSDINTQIFVIRKEISEINKWLYSDEACQMLPDRACRDPHKKTYDKLDALNNQLDCLRRESRALLDKITGFEKPKEEVAAGIYTISPLSLNC